MFSAQCPTKYRESSHCELFGETRNYWKGLLESLLLRLRGIKMVFLTPERYDENPVIFSIPIQTRITTLLRNVMLTVPKGPWAVCGQTRLM